LRRGRAEMGEGYDVDLRCRILVGHWPPISIEQTSSLRSCRVIAPILSY
jgi:hypothetical protein